jgi:predicted SprT family Zn-dependent metalloprotease
MTSAKVVMHETEEDDDDDDEVIVETTPTEEAYPELQTAYDYFNGELFSDELPPCLITLAIKGKSLGYYWSNRFESTDGEVTAELALNPEIMKIRGDRDTLSTLVHEMVHAWQHTYGKPSRNAYHNKEWATKMESIGLMPSHTGQPGGKRTGQGMTHYIIDGGPFDAKCAWLLNTGFHITWKSAPVPKKKPNRTKYRCPACAAQVWGKAELHIACEDCSSTMEVVDL